MKTLVPISMRVLAILAALLPTGPASRAADMLGTAYREIRQHRQFNDVDVPDFSDNMESGSLLACARWSGHVRV